MRLQLVTKPLNQLETDYIGIFVFENEKPSGIETKELDLFFKDNPKFGKKFEIQILYSQNQKYFLVGAGKKEKFDFETAQNASGTVVKALLRKAVTLAIILPEIENLDHYQLTQAIVIGAEISSHDMSLDYKSEREDQTLKSLQIVTDKMIRDHSEGLRDGQVISEGINLAKRLGDMPPNEMTPTYFLNEIKKVAKEGKLKLTIIDEKLARKKGMGAFTAVAAGSEEPSYIVALEYRGEVRSSEKWGLVGKGVTFDSGGLNIKSGDGMIEMKYDMCGASSVLGTMLAISKIKPKANVVGVMVLTENLVSGKALKPGDILKTYSGKTVEVLNTDAEGRLILLDGLSLAQKDFKATRLVDLASLSGAIVVALGDFHTGLFSNNDQFAQNLIKAGSEVGEKFWQMPLGEEFAEMVKGEYADLSNLGHGGSMGSRTAGSITAAKFIEAIIEQDRPWIHLDIAGTAWDLKPKPYRSIGAVGVGIKTLVRLIAG